VNRICRPNTDQYIFIETPEEKKRKEEKQKILEEIRRK
jgi:hypothetical protein